MPPILAALYTFPRMNVLSIRALAQIGPVEKGRAPRPLYNSIQSAKYCNLIGQSSTTELNYIVVCPQ